MTLSEMAAAPPPTTTTAAPVATTSGNAAIAPTMTALLPATPLSTSRSSTSKTLPPDSGEAPRTTRRQAMATSPAASSSALRSDAAPDARIVPLAELPDNIRREIPALTFAGASYSGDAASRMVIINGQVFHEGDTITKGLVLQQIRLRTAVLGYRGYRYEVTY